MTTWWILLICVGVLLAIVVAFLGYGSFKYIAIWEILSGLTIIGNLLLIAAKGYLSQFGSLSLVTDFAVGLFALWAGVLLWRGSPLGRKLSVAAQGFQTAWISLPFLQIGSTLGPLMGVRLTATTLTFTMGFYGRGGLSLGGTYPLDVTINLFGIFALLALLKPRVGNRAPV